MRHKLLVMIGLFCLGCSGTAETNFAAFVDIGVDAGSNDAADAGLVDMPQPEDMNAGDLSMTADLSADTGADFATTDASDTPDLLASPDQGVDASMDMSNAPPAGVDNDNDGLEDLWEFNAGDTAYLDWTLEDSDQDGTPDGAEDYDGDGLTNLEEFQTGQRSSDNQVRAPHPLRLDLLVELDEMQGKTLSARSLELITSSFAAAGIQNPDGTTGIGVHIFRDQTGLATFDFDGTFTQRHNFIMFHAPAYTAQPAPLPVGKMLHVLVVTRRTDSQFRGAEVVTEGSGDVEKTGMLIYYDALDGLHPQCGIASANVPPITLDDALAGAFVHEMGHMLQLGHEDSTGGGVNPYNVMVIPTTCTEARQRFQGEGNLDSTLGATETTPYPAFSVDAINLMRFDTILSVHTSTLLDGDDGFEM